MALLLTWLLFYKRMDDESFVRSEINRYTIGLKAIAANQKSCSQTPIAFTPAGR